MKENKTITNLNIEGKNNDMIDVFEKYINDIIFSSDLKKLVKLEIIKLRREIKNKNIKFTDNEQNELKILLKNIIDNKEINEKDKIKFLINIMNHKLNNEIKELNKDNIKSPNVLIKLIEKNQIIKKYGDITDYYNGNSKYLIIIFPIKHRSQRGNLPIREEIFNISDKDLDILINQDKNLMLIIGELIKNGISLLYSFEGFEMIELSKNLPLGIQDFDIEAVKKYEELLKNPIKNKDEIIKYEKTLTYFGFNFLNPEIKYDEKILSYGVDNVDYIKISNDLEFFLEHFNYIKNKDEKFIKRIERFIEQRKIYYLNSGLNEKEINNYLINLKKILIPENINLMSINSYLLYISRNNYYYKFTKRNENVVKNLQQLYKNTRNNSIMLQFGGDHFKNEKNIKEGLKEKGISFVEVTPFTEK